MTTRCKDRKGKEFQGCLDYVFVSEGWKLEKFINLSPTRVDRCEQKMNLEVLPSEQEGSDHVSIRAILL